VLPVKAGDLDIPLRTDLPDASIPPSDAHVSPERAARFATLESPSNGDAQNGAGRAPRAARSAWSRANKGGYGDVIQLGNGSSAPASKAMC